MATTTLPTRKELDPAYTWNIESLFPDEKAYLAEYEAAEGDLQKLSGYAGRLGESAATLAEFFDHYWQTLKRMQKLRLYTMLPVSVDQDDQEAKRRAGHFQGLATRYSQATAFVAPELLAIGNDTIQVFMREEESLRYLERYFEKLENSRPHVRSQEVEEVLGALGDPFSSVERAYNSLANGEIRFEPVKTDDGREFEVARSSYEQLRMSSDREIRHKAYDSYTGGFLAYRNTFTDLYLGEVKQSVFQARVRGYESTLEEQLKPREVPFEVLDAVVDTFRKNLGVWHRYWAARRKILGVERHEEWDIFAPLSPNPPTVPYSQAVEWVIEGMKPLGKEYLEPLQRGLLEERWVDVYPNRGKRDGAFAASAYESQPFIMMSFHDDLESVSTLAHELGHAMHNVVLKDRQPVPYANYAMMVAETASNFNQALVRSYLLEELTGEAERLAILDEAFYNFHRYFFIMPTLVRFELEVHSAVERGEGLTADRLNEIMRDLFQEGYGNEIDATERTGITWAQFGHLYVPFYTFQYAVGISAAAALSQKVIDAEEGAVERYLEFLRAGSSQTPVDQLKAAGVDMTTSEPIETAFAQLEGYVTELEEIAEKR